MQNPIITNKLHRRSIRLSHYNYASEGWYFVTICTLERRPIFGNIVDNKMILNKYGEIITDEWMQTAKLRHNVKLDDFIVMPDHFHGIIMLNGV